MYLDPGVSTAVKILVVGHFGVGKTTCIGSISEIEPLQTEEEITEASEGFDDLSSTPDKTTTTVAMDFGRLTLSDQVVLYLFGTPGQERFKEMWEELSRGALGALVLVDPERLSESFPVLDLVESFGLTYAIGVNHFQTHPAYPMEEVREALNLSADTPVVACDVRDQRSSAQALITLVNHLLSLLD
ncbi:MULTISPECIES: GTP-binding protein [Streptomyces]|uniref:ATP-binding protein n=1 Tax=Streptomyces tsukubensis (strain DSM 42081 / NBRC 108919 / NRRL 18488 / 9993) TaxID=1114943 RepID=I2N8T4_STRT9|nr:ATP/GTP-binding protein [Streptomyces tsukubensis]MYS64062.1 ATP/GTP-binding protein [Streptomyces sp. SID5473]AZK97301.1 ATP-binding protein [Streptomyces tsukubensis]EIF93431.1 ATP-binding protein [Streptomyces tsukubensis NRRL18488]QKM66736.1 ATP-binding protein [Streptomyces tsukubensis NRRL18488]TAI44916.1 ATP/GTP-binding protein [Streptomyces tsukubensis]